MVPVVPLHFLLEVLAILAFQVIREALVLLGFRSVQVDLLILVAQEVL